MTPTAANFAETLSKVKDKNAKSNTSDYLGVMALVAIMEPVTDSQKFSRNKVHLESHPSNKMKVWIVGPMRSLFSTESNGQTLSLLEKTGAKVLAYLKWEISNKWKGQP